MTLLQASEKFDISLDKLHLYEKNGLIKGTQVDKSDYSEEEIKKVAVINLLSETGLDYEEIKSFLSEAKTNSEIARKIGLLKRQRGRVLDNIHDSQKLLQCLDYLIHEIVRSDYGYISKSAFGRTDRYGKRYGI